MSKTHLDQEILAMLHQGASSKNEAITIIVNQFGPLLYPQINRITKNREWTNDCLQNVFIKVFEKIEHFKGESSMYSWLYRIAHNETLNFLAKEKLRTGIEIGEGGIEIIAGHSLLDGKTGDEIALLLYEAISQLPSKQAVVFELKYFQDKKYSEISSITGISEGGLKANYHHAVKKIEDFLKKQLNH